MTLESLRDKISLRAQERATGSYTKRRVEEKGSTGQKFLVTKKVYLLRPLHSVAEISAKILMGWIWKNCNREGTMPQ